MTTIFISGSRHIRALTPCIKQRIDNITRQGFTIVVGDASGVDTQVQRYLTQNQYSMVSVYCSGKTCRNNIGQWREEHIQVSSQLTGRAFYTEKDKAMANQANYGLVLWDGKSQGSLNNVRTLIQQGKPTLVYLSVDKTFHTLKKPIDVQNLLVYCKALKQNNQQSLLPVNVLKQPSPQQQSLQM